MSKEIKPIKTAVEKQPGSNVEIKITLAWSDVASYKDTVMLSIQKDYEADGFRKGNVPIATIEKNVSASLINEMMAEEALNDIYPTIIKDNNIDALGRPEVIFTKLAAGNDVECTIKTAVYPEFKLPDYKKIAKNTVKEVAEPKEGFAATDEEVTQAFKELQHMRAHQELHKEGGHDEHDHNHAPIDEKDYPEVNDAFAGSFGFEDLEKMREKVRENLAKEKEQKHSEKKRLAIVEKVIEETNIDIPSSIIDTELDQMIARMKHDIQMMGMQFDDYLTHLKKTEAELRTEYTPDAIKRAKLNFIVEKLALAENLKPSDEETEKEIQKIMEAYPDADRTSATMYITTTLTNQKVFDFLEKSAQ